MGTTDNQEVIALRFELRGRVQGVGFRYFALQQARAIGVVGWVKNLPDGRVAAYVEGRESKVRQFERALREGPAWARVDEVLELPARAEGSRHFEIRH